MKHQLYLLSRLWLTLSLFLAPLGFAKEEVLSIEDASQKMRHQLTPFLAEKLQEHCGEECPSFQIHPQYKTVIKESSIENLGFQNLEEEVPATPELQSIQVSLWVDKAVKKQAQESLKNIVESTLTNAVSVPVRVELKSLASPSPLLNKKAQTKLQQEEEEKRNTILSLVQRLIWPVTLFLVGFLSFVALVLFLRNKRALLKAALDAQAAKIAAEKAEREAATAAVAKKEADSRIDANLLEKGILDLLENRPDDLKWFIESRTKQNDTASLKKILTLFPAQKLTAKLDFSPSVFGLLASFPEQPELNPTLEILSWMRHNMEKAHWRRLEEQKRPLAVLGRLTNPEIAPIFKKLASVGDRALFLLSIPEERWPECLSNIGSEERVQLGLAIAQYHHLTPTQRHEVEQGLAERIRGAEQSTQLNNLSEDLEKFTLYLPEIEGERLWKSLAGQYSTLQLSGSSRSLDETFQDMSLKEALEVFTRISLQSLAILLEKTTEANKKRINSSLPKALQERLKTRLHSGTQPSESEMMKARAEFWVEYRKFKKGMTKTA